MDQVFGRLAVDLHHRTDLVVVHLLDEPVIDRLLLARREVLLHFGDELFGTVVLLLPDDRLFQVRLVVELAAGRDVHPEPEALAVGMVEQGVFERDEQVEFHVLQLRQPFPVDVDAHEYVVDGIFDDLPVFAEVQSVEVHRPDIEFIEPGIGLPASVDERLPQRILYDYLFLVHRDTLLGCRIYPKIRKFYGYGKGITRDRASGPVPPGYGRSRRP